MRKSLLSIMAVVALLLPLAVTVAASPASAAAPVAAIQTVAPAGMMAPMVGVHNCTSSWWNPAFCTDFNRTDQQALRAGSTAAIGVLLCYVGVPCGIVAVTLAVAEVYLHSHGYCTHYLWVRGFRSG